MKNLISMPGKKAILGSRYENLDNDKISFESWDKMEARQQIIDLLSKSQPINKPCLCGEAGVDRFEVLSLIERNYLPANIVLCKTCGLIRLNPVPTQNFYNEVYSKFYWRLMHGNKELTKNRFNLSVRRALPYSIYLKNKCSLDSKEVLEIGASYGAGLFVLKDTGSKCLVGYDYDKDFIEKGIEYSGVDLRHGGVSEAVNHGKAYDVVILRHVLEHFLDPFSELQELKNLVNDKGLLFVEVPGVMNLSYWTDDPGQYFDIFHPYSFSLNTLKMLMFSAGFSMVDGNDHIYSLWKKNGLIELKNEFLCDEFSVIKKHLIDAELKRLRTESFNNSLLGKIYNYSSIMVKKIIK